MSSLPGSSRKLTPMLKQYLEAKAACPDAILMFRMGDFFELFFDDAKIASHELEITLTARDKSDDPIPMAGVPHHAVSGYIARLVEKGYSVALCDQVEDPKFAKGLVRREITQLITPGTVCDLDALDPTSSHYLAWISEITRGGFLLCLLDVLAGELLLTTVADDELRDECTRMNVREVLTVADLRDTLVGELQSARIPVRVPPLDDVPDAASMRARFGAERMDSLDATMPGATLALSRIIAFAESTQRRVMPHLRVPQIYRRDASVIIDASTRRNLELLQSGPEARKQGSVLWHIDRCKTALGSRMLRRWMLFPLRDMSAIDHRLDTVAWLMNDRPRRESVQEHLRLVRDLERLAGRISLQRATPRDLGALRASLQAVPTLHAMLETAPEVFAGRWRSLDVCEDVRILLEKALVDEPPQNFSDASVFAKGYCDQLDEWIDLSTEGHGFLEDLETRERARTGLNTLKVRYNKIFGFYIEVSRAQAASVPADYERKQTLVNAERYISAELKVHEERVLKADDRRKRRETVLYAELMTQLSGRVSALRRLARMVGELDAVQSLGEAAEVHRYVRPVLLQEPVLHIVGGRHPVIERLMPGGERFVPVDVSLDTSTRQILMLTGPNMAGKSTVMRQTALIALLAHMGSFVPADEARVGVCDRIFTRVGASDNLGEGQSTFMVEMLETATILRHATSQSLVLLDEIGRGTSTYDGVSIAWAVAEHIHDSVGCRTLFATHYHELTALSDEKSRIHNVQMAVVEQNGEIVFLRRLLEGAVGRSYGIEVARLAHLPSSVLSRARQMLASLEQGARPNMHALPEESIFVPMLDPIRAQLRHMDPLRLSPMEALAMLQKLCGEAHNMDPSSRAA